MFVFLQHILKSNNVLFIFLLILTFLLMHILLCLQFCLLGFQLFVSFCSDLFVEAILFMFYNELVLWTGVKL